MIVFQTNRKHHSKKRIYNRKLSVPSYESVNVAYLLGIVMSYNRFTKFFQNQVSA